jgi:hypothetical protein
LAVIITPLSTVLYNNTSLTTINVFTGKYHNPQTYQTKPTKPHRIHRTTYHEVGYQNRALLYPLFHPLFDLRNVDQTPTVTAVSSDLDGHFMQLHKRMESWVMYAKHVICKKHIAYAIMYINSIGRFTKVAQPSIESHPSVNELNKIMLQIAFQKPHLMFWNQKTQSFSHCRQGNDKYFQEYSQLLATFRASPDMTAEKGTSIKFGKRAHGKRSKWNVMLVHTRVIVCYPYLLLAARNRGSVDWERPHSIRFFFRSKTARNRTIKYINKRNKNSADITTNRKEFNIVIEYVD